MKLSGVRVQAILHGAREAKHPDPRNFQFSPGYSRSRVLLYGNVE